MVKIFVKFDRPDLINKREARLYEDLLEAAFLPDRLAELGKLVLVLGNRLILDQDKR